jgi:hypothetical protein
MRFHLPSVLRRAAWPALLALAPLLLAAGAGPARGQAAPAAAKTAPTANELSRQARQRISERVWRMDGSAEAAAGASQLGLSGDPRVIEIGRRIYLDGVRADGQPLVGTRLDGRIPMSGAAAACVMCHRRSALGAVEGPYQVAPISGRYLFDQDRRAVVSMNRRGNKSFNPRHEPYTLTAMAEAVRSGRHESGRELEPLMPRYALNDAEIVALASYLRGLSNAWSPGVSDRVVRLATVITPDVDPERKRIFLATLNGIVSQKNGNMVRGQRTMSSAAEMAMQTDRHWEMSVWELQGAPSTWQAQLERKYAEHPVFAVTSGLGAGNWQPVHAFCERQAVPCWFPSVGAPPTANDTDFYSVYFSRGAGLEAEVLASQLGMPVKPPARRGTVLQVYGDPALADSAVATLRTRLADKKIASDAIRFDGDSGVLARRLASLQPSDQAVFWLAPGELAKLADIAPPRATSYFSASLGGGDRLALAAGWQASARVIYPYQLPEARRRGLTYFREWLRIRNLPLENEVLQSEVFFALSYFNDTMVDMLDNVHRDYLLERAENMLSLREAAKAEDEARELSLPRSAQVDRNVQPLREMPQQRSIIPRGAAGAVPAMPRAMPPGMGEMGASADVQADHSGGQAGTSPHSGAPEGTTVYPRLSLAQNQRHASRGAYIMRFAVDGLRADSDWIIP